MTESYIGLLKRHGFKLSIALLLGYIVYTVLIYVVAFLVAILFSPFFILLEQLEQTSDPGFFLSAIAAVFVILVAVVGMIPQGFWIGGSYGAACTSVFRGQSSISSFFTLGFKHLWKMFGQQVFLFLIFMGPILLLALHFILAQTEEPPAILMALFIPLILGYFWIFLHAPLFIIVERTGVWGSIRLAFRLTIGKPGQTLLSGLIAFGIFTAILLLPLLLFFLLLIPLKVGELEIVAGVLSVLLVLLYLLFVVPYALSAGLLSIVHRYKIRLRRHLFPEDPNCEGILVREDIKGDFVAHEP